MNIVGNLRVENVTGLVFLSKVNNHYQLKPNILKLIDDMGRFSYYQKDSQKLCNTDWHLNPDIDRPYVDYINPIVDSHNKELMNVFGYDVCHRLNVWFQQYEKGDYHVWHTHRATMFSNVYYVSLSEDCPRTSFKLGAEEFEVEVSEGDIISFPSYLKHCSKPSKSDSIKTIIAFNTDFY